MEEDELQVALQQAREFAELYPITKGMLALAARMPQLLAKYSFMYGKFCVEVTYETHCAPPRWHTQISILEDIGEGEWGVPQQALLATQSWSPEDQRDADKILREALAPMDTRQSQTIKIHKGNMALHYMLNDDSASVEKVPDWTRPTTGVLH